jgi:hypothetical protein
MTEVYYRGYKISITDDTDGWYWRTIAQHKDGRPNVVYDSRTRKAFMSTEDIIKEAQKEIDRHLNFRKTPIKPTIMDWFKE